MAYRIAGIDVHKKNWPWLCRTSKLTEDSSLSDEDLAATPEQLRSLAAWLLEQEAEEVVMDSTAQCWKPVWEAPETKPGQSNPATKFWTTQSSTRAVIIDPVGAAT